MTRLDTDWFFCANNSISREQHKIFRKGQATMYRFYVKEAQLTMIEEKPAYVTIIGSDVNHIRNVLRLQPGEWIVACDGNGTDYLGRISQLCADQVEVKIEKIQDTGTELPAHIVLFQGLPKKDKMEFIIQKAVELGAAEIVPVQMHRCVMKITPEKVEKKRARWQSIAESAAKQSDRGCIPLVHAPMNWEQAFDRARTLEYNMIPYECETGMDKARELVKEACCHQSIGIFIGPEGGLEPQEVEQAIKEGVLPLSLGKRILRTETAGMALLSILMFQM
jgi:16S rRNA (uracil1498-N3)-methyltransferase